MEKQMKMLVDTLNRRCIDPEKDKDLLMEELNCIGLFFEEENNYWHYDGE